MQDLQTGPESGDTLYEDTYRKIAVLRNGKIIVLQADDENQTLMFYYDTGFTDLRIAYEYKTLTMMQKQFESMTVDMMVHCITDYMLTHETILPTVPQPSTTLN